MPPMCSRTTPPPNSYTFVTNPSRKSRSWLTTITVPSNARIASLSTSLVRMSRWLVGSSKIRKLTGSSKSLIIAKRERSPPESTLTFLSEASPPNIKAPSMSRILRRISPLATWSIVSNTVNSPSSNCAWF